jgi:hypothetical protein
MKKIQTLVLGQPSSPYNMITWGAPNWLNMPIGLININYVASADPHTEASIVTGQWGYGRQLGRIVDVLEKLIDELEITQPTIRKDHAVEEFRLMANEIRTLRTSV